MPKRYLLSLLLLPMLLAAQKRTLISGVVTAEGLVTKPISVINYNTRLVVEPRPDGKFEIWARNGDLLIFMLDDYLDQQITVGEGELKNQLRIRLKEKPVELDEVKIIQQPLKGYKVSQADLDEIKLEKQLSRPTNNAVYTGEIVNGMDFIRIGKEILGLFKKKEDKKTQKPDIPFRDYLEANIPETYYTKTLGLQPGEVYAFIDFCNGDPMAKTLVQNGNSLAVMDFLLQKSKAFRKLD